jgi:hypothetical protein
MEGDMQRQMVGLAAEFAVTSELCRRDVYAQLTFGHQKRTDLLVFHEDGELLRIEVKGQQGGSWPNCRGIYDSNAIMVLVDFYKKSLHERHDFYVLTVVDWVEFVQSEIKRLGAKGQFVELDSHNVPMWPEQVSKNGEPYKGLGIAPGQIQEHKEKWKKIVQRLERQKVHNPAA